MPSSRHRKWSAVFLGCLLIVVGLIWNGSRDRTGGAADVDAQAAKSVSETINPTDQANQTISFDGDDSTIKWSCANALGQVQVGYFYELDGAASFDGSFNLKRLEMELDVTKMRANAAALSKKLQGPGFFQTERYPSAKFISTSISTGARDGDPEGTTHVVEANFQIRDTTKSISIPVAVKNADGILALTSAFKLNRKDFGVVHPVTLEDIAIHEDVFIGLDINLNRQLESSENEPAALAANDAAGSRSAIHRRDPGDLGSIRND